MFIICQSLGLTTPTMLMWRLVYGVSEFGRGVWDAAAFWRYLRLLRVVETVRTPVLRMTANISVFLMGQLLYEHAMVPLISWMMLGRSNLVDWLFYLLWTTPLLLLSSSLNIYWFIELSNALLALKPLGVTSSIRSSSIRSSSSSSSSIRSSSSSSSSIRSSSSNTRSINTRISKGLGEIMNRVAMDYQTFFRAAAEEIMRLLMLIVANAIAQLLFLRVDAWVPSSPFFNCAVKCVCFAYMTWVQALHVFDHVWVLQSRSFDFKLTQIEMRPAYFCGFGAWMAAVLVFVPTYVGCGLYYALMPFSVLAALHAQPPPPPTSTTRPWPVIRILLPVVGSILVFVLSSLRCICSRKTRQK
jgi:hypothetical protein